MGFGSGGGGAVEDAREGGNVGGKTGDGVVKSEGEAGYTSYLPSLGSVGGWLWGGEGSGAAVVDGNGAAGSGGASGGSVAPGHGQHHHSHGHGVRGLLRRAKSGEDVGADGAVEDGSSHHHHHHLHHHTHLRGLLRRVVSGEEPEDEETAMTLMKQWVVEMVGKVPVDNTVTGGVTVQKKVAGKKRDRLVEQLCMSDAERERICLQFLRARHGDVKAAADMLRQTLAWRQRVDIDSYLLNKKVHLRGSESFMPIFILSNNIDCKQPVVYALARMYDKKKVDKDALHNAVLAFFETLYFEQIYASDQIIAIMDFRGWSIRRHAPYRAVKEGISLLQAHYPDRLGRIFLVNYPTTLRAAYTVVSPIIDGAAKEKIIWVAENIEQTLAKYLSPKSIPTWLGGDLQASIPGVDMEKEWRTARIS